MIQGVESHTLFPAPPVVAFAPEVECCALCGGSLKVKYTHTRGVKTLHVGLIRAHETVRHCPTCKAGPIHSEELAELVPPGANFGYDVIVAAGISRWHQHHSEQETVEALGKHHVEISASGVREQAAKFVTYLGIAHLEASPAIQCHFAGSGGYILHLDSTSRINSRKLMVGIDELSGFVLLGVKLSTETAEDVAGFLRQVIERYGPPLAIASDMAASIRAGIALVKELDGVGHYICHFHFLRDAGKDLMQTDYNAFSKRLEAHGLEDKLRRYQHQLEAELTAPKGAVDEYLRCLASDPDATPPKLPVDTLTAILVRNALDAFRRTDTLSFPFDQPRLNAFEQLLRVGQALAVLRESQTATKPQRRLLKRLCKLFAALEDDRELAAAARQLHRRSEIFEQLRSALRLAPPGCPEGVNHPGVGPETNITDVEADVRAFRDSLDTTDPLLLKLREQLDRHWAGLFRAPIEVRDADGRLRLIHPQRTNNIVEQYFRDNNHDHCRRSGTQVSAARFDVALADSVLVKNLNDPAYMSILLDGADDLPQRFSRIDPDMVRQVLAKERDTDLLFTKPRTARKVLQRLYTPIIIARGILEHDRDLLRNRAERS